MEINEVSELIGAVTPIATSDKLIDKVSSVFGMLFPYAGLRKRAIDSYVANIDKSDMTPDEKFAAMLGVQKLEKQIKNQQRIAEIAVEYAKPGTDFTEKSGVDEDWLDRIMDAARFVSEEKLQFMWGRVIANEFENPNSTPFNMIRILSEMSPKCAIAFQMICSMERVTIVYDEQQKKAVKVSKRVMVPYDHNEDRLSQLGLPYTMIVELEKLGLIDFSPLQDLADNEEYEGVILSYINGITRENITSKLSNIPCGNVLLTDAGNCLRRIVDKVQVEGYVDMESQYMMKKHYPYVENPRYTLLRIEENGTSGFRLVENENV